MVPKHSYGVAFVVDQTKCYSLDVLQAQLKEIKQNPKTIDYKLNISTSTKKDSSLKFVFLVPEFHIIVFWYCVEGEQWVITFNSVTDAEEFEICFLAQKPKLVPGDHHPTLAVLPPQKSSCSVLKLKATRRSSDQQNHPRRLQPQEGTPKVTISEPTPSRESRESEATPSRESSDPVPGQPRRRSTVGETIDAQLKTEYAQLSKFMDWHSNFPIVKIFQALELLSSRSPETCPQISQKYRLLFFLTDCSVPKVTVGLQPTEYGQLRDQYRIRISQLYFDFNTRFIEQKLVSHEGTPLLLSNVIRTRLTLIFHVGDFLSPKAFTLGCCIQSKLAEFLQLGVQVVAVGVGRYVKSPLVYIPPLTRVLVLNFWSCGESVQDGKALSS